jgi:hypothetical protein
VEAASPAQAAPAATGAGVVTGFRLFFFSADWEEFFLLSRLFFFPFPSPL